MICGLFILFSTINLSNSQLPQGVYRVPACPTPNNLTAWKEASAALNCTSDLENKDPRKLNNIYHCMPSNYLNETVAFCGPLTAISEGNCPVLNYEHGATAPTGRPCTESNFTNGCPTKQFFTREIYKHPACMKVNTRLRCYYANPQCATRTSFTTTLHSIVTTEGLMTTTASHFYDNNEEVSLSSKDIAIVILSAIICLAFIILLVFKCRRRIKTIACNLVRRIRNKKPRTPNDNEKKEKEPMLGEKTDKTDLNQTIEHTPGVAENEFSKSSMISLVDLESTADEVTLVRKNGEDGVLKKSPSPQCPNKDTELEVTVDIEKVQEMEEQKQLKNTTEDKETKNDVMESIITYECEDPKKKKDDHSMTSVEMKENAPLLNGSNQIASKNEGDFLRNSSKSQPSTCVSTFDEKADMEKINGMEQRIIGEKEKGNDVKETMTVTCGSEITKSRKVESTGVNTDIWGHEKRNRLLFNHLYFEIVQYLIDNDLFRKISTLLEDTRKEAEGSEDQWEQFKLWNREYNFQYNLWHLQQLLTTCGAVHLVKKCTEYAKKCPLSLVYFESKATEGKNRELITIYTTLDISQKTVSDEMNNIRKLLEDLFDLPPGEIQLRGVKKGSLILEFSLPKENVKEILHMDLSSLWSLKVFKIKTKAWKRTPDLLPSKFMLILYTSIAEPYHIRIPESVQLFVLEISNEMKRMVNHIKIEENNIKCQIAKQSCAQVPPTGGRKSLKEKPVPFENKILENMEPSIVKVILLKQFPGYHTEIEDLFSPTNARRQTAKAILLFLSGKKEKSFKNTTNCVIDMYRNKDIPPCEEGGSNDPAMAAENGLFQDTELLFEEIDSSVIDDTFEKIGDVPFDIVQKCSSGSGRKRKERAKTFYDFVNRNKEHFEIFQSILQNNCD